MTFYLAILESFSRHNFTAGENERALNWSRLMVLLPPPPSIHSPDQIAFIILILLAAMCMVARCYFGRMGNTVRYPTGRPGELGPRKLIYPYAYKKL